MTRVAVVGSGKWGTNLARNFNELNALQCICERDENRIKELGKIFTGVPLCSDIEEILEDSRVTGVVIATPPNLHYDSAVKALNAGKHVFIEKPMTLDISQAKTLLDMSGKLNRIIMVGHILLYHPAYVKLREIIEKGELGDICYIHAQRIGLGRVRREEDAMFSLAPHDISAMLYLFQEQPESLSCFGMDYLQKGIVDLAFLNMKFKNQRIGHIHVSWLSPLKIRQHTVVGTKKMAQVDEIAGKGTLKIFDKHVDPVTLNQNDGEETIVELDIKEPLKEECRHFLSSIESNKIPRSDGSQGLNVVKILNAAKESIKRKGEWINLEDV